MSIRPKRKASQIRSLNEDQMFMDQYIFEESDQHPVPQIQSKFVKPKTRIPQQQQQPVRINMIPERVVNIKAKPSLRAYLSAILPYQIRHTRIWRTQFAKENDSKSYNRASSLRVLIIENKRKRKEMMKRMSEEYEYQRNFQTREMNEELGTFRDYYPTSEPSQSQYYYKKRNMIVDRCNLSKTNSETTPIMKNTKEDISRAIEEAEKRSTAVSCQERLSQKDSRLKSPQQNNFDDYHVDAEISNYDPHNSDGKEDREMNMLNKSLIDKMFHHIDRGFLEDDQGFSD